MIALYWPHSVCGIKQPLCTSFWSMLLIVRLSCPLFRRAFICKVLEAALAEKDKAAASAEDTKAEETSVRIVYLYILSFVIAQHFLLKIC